MLNQFTKPERIAFAIGILLTTGVPFLIRQHYLVVPDLWGGFLAGLGLGVMIAIFIRVRRRANAQ